MVNKGEREILNEAARYASETSGPAREEAVGYLEDLREAVGLKMYEVDEFLGKPRNWYSNHLRAGGTHSFTRPEFYRAKDLLEVEFLRNLAGANKNDVSRGIGESRGWYADKFETGFPMDQYNDVVQFLLAMIVLKERKGKLNQDALDKIVELDVVLASRVEEIQSSIEIGGSDTSIQAEELPQDQNGEELTRIPGELVRLARTRNDWIIHMTQELEQAGFEGTEKVDIDLLWEGDDPMVVIGEVDPDEPEPQGMNRRRAIMDRGSSLGLKLPKSIIEDDPAKNAGLGIDSEVYEKEERPLYLEPLVDPDGVVGLIPAAYEDGTLFEP